MAFNNINETIRKNILVLLLLPLVASANIDCRGKAFHCVNSTHFMVCVDLGGGVSSTIDNFVIQCPPSTVCDKTNFYECEFSFSTTAAPTIDTSVSSAFRLNEVSNTEERSIVFTTPLDTTTEVFSTTTDTVSTATNLQSVTNSEWFTNSVETITADVSLTTEHIAANDINYIIQNKTSIDTNTSNVNATENVYLLNEAVTNNIKEIINQSNIYSTTTDNTATTGNRILLKPITEIPTSLHSLTQQERDVPGNIFATPFEESYPSTTKNDTKLGKTEARGINEIIQNEILNPSMPFSQTTSENKDKPVEIIINKSILQENKENITSVNISDIKSELANNFNEQDIILHPESVYGPKTDATTYDTTETNASTQKPSTANDVVETTNSEPSVTKTGAPSTLSVTVTSTSEFVDAIEDVSTTTESVIANGLLVTEEVIGQTSSINKDKVITSGVDISINGSTQDTTVSPIRNNETYDSIISPQGISFSQNETKPTDAYNSTNQDKLKLDPADVKHTTIDIITATESKLPAEDTNILMSSNEPPAVERNIVTTFFETTTERLAQGKTIGLHIGAQSMQDMTTSSESVIWTQTEKTLIDVNIPTAAVTPKLEIQTTSETVTERDLEVEGTSTNKNIPLRSNDLINNKNNIVMTSTNRSFETKTQGPIQDKKDSVSATTLELNFEVPTTTLIHESVTLTTSPTQVDLLSAGEKSTPSYETMVTANYDYETTSLNLDYINQPASTVNDIMMSTIEPVTNSEATIKFDIETTTTNLGTISEQSEVQKSSVLTTESSIISMLADLALPDEFAPEKVIPSTVESVIQETLDKYQINQTQFNSETSTQGINHFTMGPDDVNNSLSAKASVSESTYTIPKITSDFVTKPAFDVDATSTNSIVRVTTNKVTLEPYFEIDTVTSNFEAATEVNTFPNFQETLNDNIVAMTSSLAPKNPAEPTLIDKPGSINQNTLAYNPGLLSQISSESSILGTDQVKIVSGNNNNPIYSSSVLSDTDNGIQTRTSNLDFITEQTYAIDVDTNTIESHAPDSADETTFNSHFVILPTSSDLESVTESKILTQIKDNPSEGIISTHLSASTINNALTTTTIPLNIVTEELSSFIDDKTNIGSDISVPADQTQLESQFNVYPWKTNLETTVQDAPQLNEPPKIMSTISDQTVIETNLETQTRKPIFNHITDGITNIANTGEEILPPISSVETVNETVEPSFATEAVTDNILRQADRQKYMEEALVSESIINYEDKTSKPPTDNISEGVVSSGILDTISQKPTVNAKDSITNTKDSISIDITPEAATIIATQRHQPYDEMESMPSLKPVTNKEDITNVNYSDIGVGITKDANTIQKDKTTYFSNTQGISTINKIVKETLNTSESHSSDSERFLSGEKSQVITNPNNGLTATVSSATLAEKAEPFSIGYKTSDAGLARTETDYDSKVDAKVSLTQGSSLYIGPVAINESLSEPEFVMTTTPTINNPTASSLLSNTIGLSINDLSKTTNRYIPTDILPKTSEIIVEDVFTSIPQDDLRTSNTDKSDVTRKKVEIVPARTSSLKPSSVERNIVNNEKQKTSASISEFTSHTIPTFDSIKILRSEPVIVTNNADQNDNEASLIKSQNNGTLQFGTTDHSLLNHQTSSSILRVQSRINETSSNISQSEDINLNSTYIKSELYTTHMPKLVDEQKATQPLNVYSEESKLATKINRESIKSTIEHTVIEGINQDTTKVKTQSFNMHNKSIVLDIRKAYNDHTIGQALKSEPFNQLIKTEPRQFTDQALTTETVVSNTSAYDNIINRGVEPASRYVSLNVTKISINKENITDNLDKTYNFSTTAIRQFEKNQSAISSSTQATKVLNQDQVNNAAIVDSSNINFKDNVLSKLVHRSNNNKESLAPNDSEKSESESEDRNDAAIRLKEEVTTFVKHSANDYTKSPVLNENKFYNKVVTEATHTRTPLSTSITESKHQFTSAPAIRHTYPNRHIDLGNKKDQLHSFCRNKSRGRYSDSSDCTKFYVCIGRNEPIVGKCPENTVFSDLNKQCTKNYSHCIRNNEFKCASSGRFSDILKQNVYYICVKRLTAFIRFEFRCQNGYYLNKTSVKCTKEEHHPEPISDNINKSETSSASEAKQSTETKNNRTEKRSKDKSKEKFECEEEGKFVDPNNCNKYYVCTKNKKSEFRKRRKSCDSDELFNDHKKKCVDEDSYECL